MAKKDVRAQEIQQEETERVSKATVVVPQENTPYNLDSEDKRKIENMSQFRSPKCQFISTMLPSSSGIAEGVFLKICTMLSDLVSTL